jgi:hypothetical protein
MTGAAFDVMSATAMHLLAASSTGGGTDSSSVDPMAEWTKGTLNKEAIWTYYVIANYSGVFLCAVLMYSVYRNPMKTSTDILIGGLCSGCLLMSLTCGSQCLASLIYRYFYGGNIACQMEAFFHISAILVQFFSVALIAVRSYYAVVKGVNMSLRTAMWLCAGVWALCVLVTYLLSLISPSQSLPPLPQCTGLCSC